MELEPFKAFNKIPRLQGNVFVSEKIDGTNACIEFARGDEGYIMAACSRNHRLVTVTWKDEKKPEIVWLKGDNYGFGKWVVENFLKLRGLGYGRHFGEWWGQGIQRTYGLEERRFSLFNPRYGGVEGCPVSVVPQLEVLPTFDTRHLDDIMGALRVSGSVAAPGFMDPEGIVIFHERSGQLFKLVYLAGPKGTTDESGHQLPEG